MSFLVSNSLQKLPEFTIPSSEASGRFRPKRKGEKTIMILNLLHLQCNLGDSTKGFKETKKGEEGKKTRETAS